MPLQTTLNGNDLWLSYWVSHTPTPAQLPDHQLPTQLHLHPVPQQQQQQYSPSLQLSTLGIRPGSRNSSQVFGASQSVGSWGSLAVAFGHLDPEVRYYLGVLLAIAAANTVFTLVSGIEGAAIAG